MKIIATISDMSRVAAVVDAHSGKTRFIPGRRRFLTPSISEYAAIRPFGITWANDELYIANHSQLLVFDRSFNYLRTEPVELQLNTHQIAWHDARIWTVSTRSDSLVAFNPSNSSVVEFDLIEHRFREFGAKTYGRARDIHHFNSLVWGDGKLHVAGHNLREPSFINSYDAKSFELLSVHQNAGRAIHGLAVDESEMFWISTDTWQIRSSSGYALQLPQAGYPRGFALTKRYMVVAVSERSDRHARVVGNSAIDIFDRSNQKRVGHIVIRDTGSINDLRILDELDYAHGQAPFLT